MITYKQIIPFYLVFSLISSPTFGCFRFLCFSSKNSIHPVEPERPEELQSSAIHYPRRRSSTMSSSNSMYTNAHNWNPVFAIPKIQITGVDGHALATKQRRNPEKRDPIKQDSPYLTHLAPPQKKIHNGH